MTATRRDVSLGIGALALLGGCSSHAEPKLGAAGVRPDLYNCDGCEAVHERPVAGMPSHLRLASVEEPGQRMLLAGRVTLPDGAPAPGVVIYAHHTNAAGRYANGTAETEWSRQHGRLRGWVKTDSDGRYAFDTIKPAPYPDRSMPAHVHLFVMEPGKRPYYIDDAVFAGEFGVTADYVRKQELRGGSGIVTPTRRNGLLLATRDIVLERHPV